MLFGTNKSLANSIKTNTKLSIDIDGEAVEQVNLFKYLGLWFDPLLNWSSHLQTTCSKIRQRHGVIGRIRGYIDQYTAKTLIKAMVFPLFDYGDVVWSTCSITLHNRLQRLQNRAAKLVLKCPFRTPTTEVQKRIKWAPLQNIQTFHTAQMVQKCLNKEVPSYLWDTFQPTNTLYNGIETRSSQSNGLFVPSTTNLSAQKMFKYRGACTWNSLTPSLRLCSDSRRFKIQYWSQYWNPTM